MDFPVNLNYIRKPVQSMDELKQTVEILLRNVIKSFQQSPVVGSRLDIHTTDEDAMVLGASMTMQQIPNLKVKSCVKKDSNTVAMVLQYQDDIVQFQFNID